MAKEHTRASRTSLPPGFIVQRIELLDKLNDASGGRQARVDGNRVRAQTIRQGGQGAFAAGLWKRFEPSVQRSSGEVRQVISEQALGEPVDLLGPAPPRTVLCSVRHNATVGRKDREMMPDRCGGHAQSLPNLRGGGMLPAADEIKNLLSSRDGSHRLIIADLRKYIIT